VSGKFCTSRCETNWYGEGPGKTVPSSQQDYAPVYAPDGKNLAFISTRNGTTEMWIARVDGNQAKQHTRLSTGVESSLGVRM
jgi:Tol biopolymer transport system component